MFTRKQHLAWFQSHLQAPIEVHPLQEPQQKSCGQRILSHNHIDGSYHNTWISDSLVPQHNMGFWEVSY